MALPTSDNTVNVTRLGSILSTLWGKIKTALGSKANKTDLAPTYSASSTYAVGSTVIYNNTLYRCTTAITTAEAWTAAHWTATTVDAGEPLICTISSSSDNIMVCDKTVEEIGNAYYANRPIWILVESYLFALRMQVDTVVDQGEDSTTHTHMYGISATLNFGTDQLLQIYGTNYDSGALSNDTWNSVNRGVTNLVAGDNITITASSNDTITIAGTRPSYLDDMVQFRVLGGSIASPRGDAVVIKIQFTPSATAWSSGLTLCYSCGNTYNVFGIHFHKAADTSPMEDCRVIALKTHNETRKLKFKYDSTNCVVYIGTNDTGNYASGYALFHKYITATMSWSLVSETDSGYVNAADATPKQEYATTCYDYAQKGSVTNPVYIQSNGVVAPCALNSLSMGYGYFGISSSSTITKYGKLATITWSTSQTGSIYIEGHVWCHQYGSNEGASGTFKFYAASNSTGVTQPYLYYTGDFASNYDIGVVNSTAGTAVIWGKLTAAYSGIECTVDMVKNFYGEQRSVTITYHSDVKQDSAPSGITYITKRKLSYT